MIKAWLPQVANYGLGGQYSQHTDPHGYWDGRTTDPGYAQTGDRLLTIMVSLFSLYFFGPFIIGLSLLRGGWRSNFLSFDWQPDPC